MNPLHDGIDLSSMERDRIESIDLSSQKISHVQNDNDDHIDNKNGYSTVATTSHGGHGHDAPMTPSKLPQSLQNFLERIFKLKKRGTTFEVQYMCDCRLRYMNRCLNFDRRGFVSALWDNLFVANFDYLIPIGVTSSIFFSLINIFNSV